MKTTRREFIKQFSVAGVVALAALSLRPEKALAVVTDNSNGVGAGGGAVVYPA